MSGRERIAVDVSGVVLSVIARNTGKSVGDLSAETPLRDIARNWSAISRIRDELEKIFNLSIPDDVVEGWVTVGDIIRMIEEVIDAPAQEPQRVGSSGSLRQEELCCV